MAPNERQKMCSGCDGRIPVEAESCPYCGTQQKSYTGAETMHHQSLQDSLSSLHKPLYAPKTPSLMQPPPVSTNKKAAPLPVQEPYKQALPERKLPPLVAPQEESAQQEDRSSFWPLLLLTLGANLLIIGLLQLLFSDNGFLRLEWSSKYWFVYCLAALPLGFFGFSKAKQLQ